MRALGSDSLASLTLQPVWLHTNTDLLFIQIFQSRYKVLSENHHTLPNHTDYSYKRLSSSPRVSDLVGSNTV
jgi:hypothetical protein